MSTINELAFEIWYVSPTGKERRMGAFHFRFDAEAFMKYLAQSVKGNYYIKEV